MKLSEWDEEDDHRAEWCDACNGEGITDEVVCEVCKGSGLKPAANED